MWWAINFIKEMSDRRYRRQDVSMIHQLSRRCFYTSVCLNIYCICINNCVQPCPTRVYISLIYTTHGFLLFFHIYWKKKFFLTRKEKKWIYHEFSRYRHVLFNIKCIYLWSFCRVENMIVIGQIIKINLGRPCLHCKCKTV